MSTIQFFNGFSLKVMETPHWKVMESTVEGTHWHREDNVAVHTIMCLNYYVNHFSHLRSEREQMIALMAILFHDFGKPESEETKERKNEDGTSTGEMYHSYAGHEPVSANEMMSFFCSHDELREEFFAQGYDWNDLRSIKFMIEHHLPYGLVKAAKRLALRSAVAHTLGADEVCFYDMLISDCYGRISDDHDAKKAKVHEWIKDFSALPVAKNNADARKKNGLGKMGIFLNKDARQPVLYVMHGISGSGKSTFIKKMPGELLVYSEDDLRMKYAEANLDHTDLRAWSGMTVQERYDAAWKFCAMSPDSTFDKVCKAAWNSILDQHTDIVLDRMNPTRKARASFIETAKAKGYRVESIEFYISEQEAKDRQKTRGDKSLPDFRVHQVYMQMETPWIGPEVDAAQIVEHA